MTTEDERVRRARGGDLSAFNALVTDYQGLVFSLCYRMLGQRTAADDATQEAFIAAWRAIGTLRGDAFKPWMLRIAGNTCRDEMRRRGRRPSTSLDVALEAGVPEPPTEEASPEDEALDAETRQRLEAVLRQLPEEQRVAVVLCDVEGLDYSEIATAMKTSIGTVKSRIARGRGHLRDILQREPELLPQRFRQKVQG